MKCWIVVNEMPLGIPTKGHFLIVKWEAIISLEECVLVEMT